MRKKEYKQNKKSYTTKQILIILLILLSAISFVAILGRYVTNSAKDFFSRSKEFYFYSDKLSKDTSIFQIDNWTGVDPYTFTIDMNSRKNKIEAATYDIGYKIKYTCTPNAICQLSKTEGIISANTNSDLFYLTITPNTQLETGDKVTVEVEATSTSDYTKTIKGRFTLVVGKEKLTYSIDDRANSPYMTLSITNTISYYIVKENFANHTIGEKIDIDNYKKLSEADKKKCYSRMVTIDFNPNEILLDITNENIGKATNLKKKIINGKTYINGLTIEMEPISSTELRFYKIDSTKDYTYPNNMNTSIVKVTSK